MENGVFSEYEFRELNFTFAESKKFKVECIGSFEEELNVRTVIKKCRGIEKKVRSKGTGTGTVKVTAHVPRALLDEMYAMLDENLKKGVRAYGQDSLHPEFALTARVLDEDDAEMLKAYPRCLVKSNLSRKTENGAEEVAELELEISIMPDDDGIGVYEAIVSELEDESIASSWLESFTPSLVKETEA